MQLPTQRPGQLLPRRQHFLQPAWCEQPIDLARVFGQGVGHPSVAAVADGNVEGVVVATGRGTVANAQEVAGAVVVIGACVLGERRVIERLALWQLAALPSGVGHLPSGRAGQLVEAVVAVGAFRFYLLIAPEANILGIVAHLEHIADCIVGVMQILQYLRAQCMPLRALGADPGKTLGA